MKGAVNSRESRGGGGWRQKEKCLRLKLSVNLPLMDQSQRVGSGDEGGVITDMLFKGSTSRSLMAANKLPKGCWPVPLRATAQAGDSLFLLARMDFCSNRTSCRGILSGRKYEFIISLIPLKATSLLFHLPQEHCSSTYTIGSQAHRKPGYWKKSGSEDLLCSQGNQGEVHTPAAETGRLLEREQKAFWMATVQPVHQLSDDLRCRLGEVQHQQLTAHPSHWDHINFVKDQQDDITAQLQAEYLDLEGEIIGLGLDKYLTSTSDNPVNIENIPEEVLNSDCPYPELKDSLIQAFHFLSERYQRRLQNLQGQLQTTDRFCGWCADDHQRFLSTLSQYTYDIPNHRALYMDMMQRLFQDKTRQELVEHERVWDRLRFTQAQLRVVTQQFQRDQEELLARALFTLQEARHAHQEELECHRGHQHQQDVCSHLREKAFK
ncbi:Coiled-coil domain-containing protein 148 [Liparis tanakae]|uniref:Coiled-coil domain-containing protein 148 n=1 Tax=Liparis tanakae TaxID=230148 RepID=A0A4Z2J3E2_9TELE|nr:Coiled-coil domain-containing protein 148 [Liparis tanakae]